MTLATASFVAPPPDELPKLLTDWERFANEEPDMPLLVQDALLHVQFKTIHSFLDGNGRLGRLLLVLFLIIRGRLTAPLPYLSAGIERERDRRYAALRATRTDGDALPWIELFLDVVSSQSIDAVARGRADHRAARPTLDDSKEPRQRQCAASRRRIFQGAISPTSSQ